MSPVTQIFSGANVVSGFDWRRNGETEQTQLVSYSKDGSVRLWSVDDRMKRKCSVMNPGLGDHLHASTGSNPWMGLTESKANFEARSSSKLVPAANSPLLDESLDNAPHASLGLTTLFEGKLSTRTVLMTRYLFFSKLSCEKSTCIISAEHKNEEGGRAYYASRGYGTRKICKEMSFLDCFVLLKLKRCALHSCSRDQ